MALVQPVTAMFEVTTRRVKPLCEKCSHEVYCALRTTAREAETSLQVQTKFTFLVKVVQCTQFRDKVARREG